VRPGFIEALRAALVACDGNITQAAKCIGFKGPSGLWNLAYRHQEVRDVLRALGGKVGRRRVMHHVHQALDGHATS